MGLESSENDGNVSELRGRKEAMELEQKSSLYLANAVRSLGELFESKGDPKPVAKIFARYHWICLQEGDVDGFLWALKLLQGIINTFQEQDLQPDCLSAFLRDCFESTAADDNEDENREKLQQESPHALADLHVATRHLSEKWFVSCFESASSELVKYHAGIGLGSVIRDRDGDEDCRNAVKWFELGKSMAEGLYAEFKAIAAYEIMKTLVKLGETERARTVLEPGSVLSPALFDIATAIIEQKEGGCPKNIVAAFAAARRKLVKVMVSLKRKLEQKTGSGCCSPRCVLNYTRGGRFTQLYQLLLPRSETLPGISLKACFDAYDLYKEARVEILKLQESQDDAEDAKSYIEQGIEIMYQDVATVSVTGIDFLVLGHQIAVKTKDLDSLWAAGVYLDEYVGRETKDDAPGMMSRMVASFRKHSRDGEDEEAWTKFYVGRTGSTHGKVSEEQYRFLEQSLERSKKSAVESGYWELIVNSIKELFYGLVHNQIFQRAHQVQKAMETMARSKDLAPIHARIGEAAAEDMEGYLSVSWGDHSSETCRHFQRAFDLVQDLARPYPGSIKTYLQSSYRDGDLSYNGRVCVYVIAANASRMHKIYSKK